MATTKNPKIKTDQTTKVAGVRKLTPTERANSLSLELTKQTNIVNELREHLAEAEREAQTRVAAAQEISKTNIQLREERATLSDTLKQRAAETERLLTDKNQLQLEKRNLELKVQELQSNVKAVESQFATFRKASDLATEAAVNAVQFQLNKIPGWVKALFGVKA